LNAGAKCVVNVTFDPTKSGARSALVGLVDNGGGSPQSAPISGTGTQTEYRRSEDVRRESRYDPKDLTRRNVQISKLEASPVLSVPNFINGK
jgi:hypothetical protein